MQPPNLSPPSDKLDHALQQAIDQKTKPPGSLGQLERLAFRIGRWQQTLTPTLTGPALAVFAGDHGIAKAGVSPYPQTVTAQMVANFLAGGAAINVFTRQHNLTLHLVDTGVAADLPHHPQLLDYKIAYGTANFRWQPAMKTEEMQQAIANGRRLAQQWAQSGCNLLGLGEMGIANTSSAAMLMHCLLDLPLADCVGRGSGHDEQGLDHKLKVLQAARDYHGKPDDPLAALQLFGGFEIATMVGVMMEAAVNGMLLIIDGFIVSSALLVAQALCPHIHHACIFAHRGSEKGHTTMLTHLQGEPLLNLNLRLGEGSGAALAYPLIVSAVAFLNQMATFSSAGVSDKNA